MTIGPGFDDRIQVRKRRHIDVCLSEAVQYQTVTTGLERYRLPYNALTQTDLAGIKLGTEFLGVPLRAPVLIGSMTGGSELSGTINRNLATAAQALGVGMMLGSQRVMLGEESVPSFQVREVAPDVLLVGNIGLAQLNREMVPELRRALAGVGANALAVHTNPLQEAVQYKGDTDFTGSLERVARGGRDRRVSGAAEGGRARDRSGRGGVVDRYRGGRGRRGGCRRDVVGTGGAIRALRRDQ